MEDQDYQALRTEVFARLWSEVAPLAEEIEETESIPRDRLFPILADLKVFAMLIPEQYGGLGLSIAQYLPVIAEFAKVHGGIRALVHVHNSMCHAYAELGSEEQARAVLPAAARGEKSVAFALTEPDHGTGADLGTTAVRDGDSYVLNGRKWLITNSDFASHFIVFARTGTGGRSAVSALSVERGLPGFTIEALPETMGCKGGQHGQLTFDNVRVPATDLLGQEGEGLAGMERSLEISRVLVAGSSLGTAEYALELSLQHARERVTFGKPIAERQAVQRYLAEMAQDVYALRLMLDDVADKYDRGQPIPLEASLVKLFGLEAVGRVTDRALLVHGGIGYTRARSIERLYRDARLNWLEEGTPTIQHMVAARQLVDGNGWAQE
ncbi:MAG: acyl-CoA dehydrogenase family protein [Mycobacteriales bacterium]